MTSPKKLSKLPAWYNHPDKCGGGSRSGYRCAGWSRTKSHPPRVKCKKWVKAVKKCGGKKFSRKKPAVSRRRKSKKTVKQLRADCKAKGLVYDAKTKRCRASKRKSRRKSAKKSRRKSAKKSRRRKSKKTVKQLRADCKAKGLVYDAKTKRCRASKRKSRRKSAKKSRRKSAKKSRRRKSKKTVKQLRADCKAKGLVYDAKTKRCRASKRKSRRKSAKKSRRRKSKKTVKQLRADCKAKGLVYDAKTKRCRASKRKSRRKSAKKSRRKSAKKSRRRKSKKTVKQLRADCKAKGLVYDAKTKRCRASKRKSRYKNRKTHKISKSAKGRKSPRECVNLAMHGRTPSEKAKYAKRKGPPFSARDCPGEKREGNDGDLYESRPAGKSHRWFKVMHVLPEDRF